MAAAQAGALSFLTATGPNFKPAADRPAPQGLDVYPVSLTASTSVLSRTLSHLTRSSNNGSGLIKVGKVAQGGARNKLSLKDQERRHDGVDWSAVRVRDEFPTSFAVWASMT
ncbi:uncharacterized protein EV422DRAFT_568802 [Fimicolochytrium jonesii]|uniref:uncharacterized protein n=1 Tax=Fimicolochytrium jonesii TaxID=1396493 RepID=UPI0022FEF38A|nr:uncharacterized protein EV422DRAFT_568802 [Fimicolochytrium jonesii]KAI8819370.1 hypothetical protein EV422DRAFT_568802 [Fimicolochytrium jonesii]